MCPRRSDSTWQEVTHIVAAFEAFQKAVARSADPQVRSLADAFAEGLVPGQQAIAAGPDGRWPTGLLTGLRQGGREIPDLIEMLPEAERAQAIEDIELAGGTWLRLLISGTAKRANAILKRGRIINEDEYYCVREHVDHLEGQDKPSEVRRYYALLDEYQGGSRSDATT